MPDNDKQFRLSESAATHYHDGEPVGTEPFTPSDTEKTMLGDLLIPAHDEEESDGPESVESADEQGAAEFVGNNANDVAAAIEAGDADGHLAEVRDAESNDRDRKTVHNALDARADETGEDAGDHPEEE